MTTAKWYQNSPSTWVLKETSEDGCAVLARITQDGEAWHWEIGHRGGFSETRYAAQRQVRAALREEQTHVV
jgi:hypothetical protein